MGVALGDYLHTGRMSLLLSHFDIEYAALYRNDRRRQVNFTDMSIASGIARGTQGYVGWGDAFVDFSITMAGRISSWSTGMCIRRWTAPKLPPDIWSRSFCL